MATKIANELLNQQIEEATRVRPPKNGVEASKSTAIDYNAKLQKIVKEISKDINRMIMPLVRSLQPEYMTDSVFVVDSWVDSILAAIAILRKKWTGPEFAQVSYNIAREFVTTANQVNRERFNKNLKGFGIDVYGDNSDLQDMLRLSIEDNTRLIESIPDQYLTNVQSIIYSNMRAGLRSSAIASSLADQLGVTERRAKLIARDQTAKVNGDLNKARQTNVGFNYFRWLTSKDQRVRERHEEIADKVTAYGPGVYRWDNPPLDENNQPIIPGQAINCRCVGLAISDDEVEENRKAGRTRQGIYR